MLLTKMYLQSHSIVLILLIMFISNPNCYSKVQANPFSYYLDQIYHVKNEPSTYLGSMEEHKDTNFEPGLANMIKYDDNEPSFEIRRLAQVDAPSSSPKIVNVNYYGAKGDGRTDDTEAFKKAWKEACSSNNGVLVIPKNKKYLLKPITFSGPCKSSLTMNIYGTIIASGNRSNYEKDRSHWIMFENIQNFKVQGPGTVDGSGKIWWKNSCKINKNLPCKNAPTAVTFYNCKNLRVQNLAIKNAQQMHISFQKCVNVRAVYLMVTSPGNSPNTDGIHVTDTQNIQISRCAIKTGDDCISIVSGSKNVKATDIICGPGHGISIGSLGAGNSEDYVSDVLVNRAKLSGTTNGVRIKTWQGGSGYAKNIKFQNIEMHNVTNPIIIDQHYCDQEEPCKEQGSAVQVQNVVYKSIKGTSNSDVAIKFDCSKRYHCQGIVLQDINLVRQEDGKKGESSCENVNSAYIGNVTPKCS